MKKLCVILAAALAASAMPGAVVLADNPPVQTRYTADPAPMVGADGETLYLFTSHDEPEGGENGAMYVMNDWNLYSTKDMVNWTDEGVPTSYAVFDWSKGDAWAIQTVRGFDGRYYLYAPVTGPNAGAIGVAVADRPEGPYTDAIGKPLTQRFSFIDPSVYVDNDTHRAFIVWGNPDPYFAELNEDMITFKTKPVKISHTEKAFSKLEEGRTRDTGRIDRYEEGPWLSKKGDYWYLTYAGNGIPEDLEYSICGNEDFLKWVDTLEKEDGTTDYSDVNTEYAEIEGPFTYGNILMPTFDSGTFTNHPGPIDFKDKSYLFYHAAKLPGANGYRRSVAVDEMTYNADGSINEVVPTTTGPEKLGNLNPYVRVEAETMAFSEGLKSGEYYTTAAGEKTDTFTGDDTKNVYITGIEDGDYIKVANVDFGAEVNSIDTSAYAGNDAYIAGYDESGALVSIRKETAGGTLAADFDDSRITAVSAYVWKKDGMEPLCDKMPCENGGAAEAGIFTASVASGKKGGEIELRLDGKDGRLIGKLPVSYTGGEDEYQEKSIGVSGAEGLHDLYLVFKGESRAEELFNFDYWKFTRKGDHTLTALNAELDDYKIDTVSGANTANMKVSAIYADGTVEDVTSQAAVTSDNVSYAGGVVTGTAYGDAVINVSYGGVSETVKLWVKDLSTEEKVDHLEASLSEIKLVYGGTPAEFTVTAVYEDGHTEDVTDKAVYAVADASVADSENGSASPKVVGSTTVNISFKGKLGDAKSIELPITVVSNMIKNGDFEETQTVEAPWTEFTSTLSIIDDGTGNHILKAADRDREGQGTGNGAHYTIGTDVKPGKTYRYSAKIKYTDGPDTKTFVLSFWNAWQKFFEDASWGDIFGNYTLQEVTAAKGEWAEFSGEVAIPEGANIADGLALAFTTTWAADPTKENDLMDYYLDDVTFALVDGSEAPVTPTEDPGQTTDKELIANGDFESGNTDAWTADGCTIAAVTDERANGNYSLLISAKNATGSSATQAVELIPGRTYRFSASYMYKNESGPAERECSLTLHKTNWEKWCDESGWDSSFRNLAYGTVKKGEWTTISGEVTIPEDADTASAVLFFETTWTANPTADNDLMDLYIDDVSFKLVGGSDEPDVPQEQQMLLWYDFTDGVNDASGSGNDGTNNGVTIADGKAVFAGDGGYISMPNGLLKNADAATVSVTFKNQTEDGKYKWLWCFGNDTDNNFYFTPSVGWAPDLSIAAIKRAGVKNGDEQQITYTGGLKAGGEYVTITVVLDGDNSRMYRDGELVKTADSGAIISKPSDLGNTAQNYLGKSLWGGDVPFKGEITDFKVYNYALSDSGVIYDLALTKGDGAADFLKDWATPENAEHVIQNVELKTADAAADGFSLSWTSSDESVITADGKIASRPATGALAATLTMALTVNGEEKRFDVPITIPGKDAADYALTVSDEKGVDIQDTMWGLFFEDISRAADGGLYAEQVYNRSFENLKWVGVDGAVTSAEKYVEAGVIEEPDYAWSSDGTMEYKTDEPLNRNNTHYLEFTGTSFDNDGYDGFYMTEGDKYNVSLYAKSAGYTGGVTVTITDGAGNICGTARVTDSVSNEWNKYSAVMTADKTVKNAKLTVSLDSEATVDFDMISMIADDAVGGIFRKDLAELLKDMKPGFLRFPGGCVVEGFNTTNAYKWKNTVGPVEERIEQTNRWAVDQWNDKLTRYNQSFGIGYYEYMLLCEYLGCEAVPVLPVGIGCQYQASDLIPMYEDDGVTYTAAFQALLDDAVDLIDFANSTDFDNNEWAALRKKMGHEEPFNLTMVAIGNEQWETDTVNFFERYTAFEKYVHQRYPAIKLLGTAGPASSGDSFDKAWDFLRNGVPTNGAADFAYAVDEHYYNEPDWFLNNTDRYDNYDRKVKVFAGEYASRVGSDANTLHTALTEAAYMTGLEKNADVVYMCSYAPLFARIDWNNWGPNLIWFDGANAYGTPDYYEQKMYATNKGDYTLKSALESYDEETLYQTVAYEEETGDTIVKLVNVSDAEKNVRLNGVSGSAKVETLTSGDIYAKNSIEAPTNCATVESSAEISNGGIYTMPANSFVVLRIHK